MQEYLPFSIVHYSQKPFQYIDHIDLWCTRFNSIQLSVMLIISWLYNNNVKVNIIEWVAWIMHRGTRYLVTCSQKSFWQLYLHNTTEKSPCHTQGHSPFWGLLPLSFYLFSGYKKWSYIFFPFFGNMNFFLLLYYA